MSIIPGESSLLVFSFSEVLHGSHHALFGLCRMFLICSQSQVSWSFWMSMFRNNIQPNSHIYTVHKMHALNYWLSLYTQKYALVIWTCYVKKASWYHRPPIVAYSLHWPISVIRLLHSLLRSCIEKLLHIKRQQKYHGTWIWNSLSLQTTTNQWLFHLFKKSTTGYYHGFLDIYCGITMVFFEKPWY